MLIRWRLGAITSLFEEYGLAKDITLEKLKHNQVDGQMRVLQW